MSFATTLGGLLGAAAGAPVVGGFSGLVGGYIWASRRWRSALNRG
jgi:hypothetical protein